MELDKKITTIFDILADTIVFLGIMHFATFLVLAYSPINSALSISLLQLIILFAFLAKMYEKIPFQKKQKISILINEFLFILLIIVLEYAGMTFPV